MAITMKKNGQATIQAAHSCWRRPKAGSLPVRQGPTRSIQMLFPSFLWASISGATCFPLFPPPQSRQAVQSSLSHDNGAIVNGAWASFPPRVKADSSRCPWLVSTDTICSRGLSAPRQRREAGEPKPSYRAGPYANPAGPPGLSRRIRSHLFPCEISPHMPSVRRGALQKMEPFHNWQEQMEGNWALTTGVRRLWKAHTGSQRSVPSKMETLVTFKIIPKSPSSNHSIKRKSCD